MATLVLYEKGLHAQPWRKSLGRAELIFILFLFAKKWVDASRI